ncbi:MAG: FtsW/RodA/SpoVE family cell cycle protein [Ruminococcus sp.]|jgi:rod shape determining protein RodA|nr:FtsW/RodA/SpoVE family cell cycle protein [Ruminococcus sp.]
MVNKLFGFLWSYFRKLDKKLFFAVVLLGTISVLLLYSMGINELRGDLYQTQALTVVMGAGAALFISALDYKKFSKLWFLYMPAAIALNMLTFTSLGFQPHDNVDDKAWIDLGVTTLQPSEFLKIAFILSFAFHLYKLGDNINKLPHLILLGIHAAVPMGIVFMQGDDGTLVIFILITLSMLFAAGLSWKIIIPALIVMPAVFYAAWEFVLKPHQKGRFQVLYTPVEERDAYLEQLAYQQDRGLLALGSGKVFGNGLFGADYVYVPEAQNDFIFTYVGQCFGFVGCVILIALLGYVCFKTIADSRIAKDDLGKYICVGVWALIFFHCLLNLGMVFYVTPVIGVWLPFLSQGGTAMLAAFFGIGLVMSTYSHSEKTYRMFYEYE